MDTFKKALSHIKKHYGREYDILCNELSYYHKAVEQSEKQKLEI